MAFRRMIPFILVNILVSAVTVTLLWRFYEGRRIPTVAEVTPVVVVEPTTVPDSVSSEPGIIVGEGGNSAEPVAETPTEIPTGPVTHVVQAGEFLGAISVQYDISMQEIMDANNLNNADAIFVGQELTIPYPEANPEPVVETGGSETVAQPAPDAPEPTPFPTAAIATGTSTFEINVNAAGDVTGERVELINTGSNFVDLNGWTLSNDTGSTFTFGATSVFGDGAGVTIHTRSGEATGTDLYWGLAIPAWAPGNVIVLRDAAGNIQAEFTVP